MQEELGLKPGDRAFEIGAALSSSNTIRRQPRVEPVQKKGLTAEGHVIQAFFT